MFDFRLICSGDILHRHKAPYKAYLDLYLLSMALQPFVGPWQTFQFLDLYTVGRTPWTGGSACLKVATYTKNNKKHRINAYKHP
jgi:hypothetical protein